ncbi:MAG: lamin tail domain-containing protein [Patescibacteria group bacterium]
MKNICVLLCALFCVAGNNKTLANPFISEVMYNLLGNDTGKEWIEVVNASGTPLPLTNWFVFESEVNHRIRFVSGSDTIPAGGIAVICSDAFGFSTNHPDFNGNLFESSFELSNIGETISLRDHNKNTVDAITYSSLMGGNGDGNSLNHVGASLVAMVPTPGTNSYLSILAFSRVTSDKAVMAISELVSDTTKIEFSRDLISWFIADVVSSGENMLDILIPENTSQCFFRVVRP